MLGERLDALRQITQTPFDATLDVAFEVGIEAGPDATIERGHAVGFGRDVERATIATPLHHHHHRAAGGRFLYEAGELPRRPHAFAIITVPLLIAYGSRATRPAPSS